MEIGATISAITVLGRGACFAQTEGDFLKTCSFAKGDPVAMVKAFYGIHVDPKKYPTVKLGPVAYEGPTAHQYHFSQWGVWVFFDKDLQVNTIRFDPPHLPGRSAESPLGDTVDRIRRVRGEPTHQFQGMPDLGALEKRKMEKANLPASLPHPASFEQRMEMVEDMARIDSQNNGHDDCLDLRNEQFLPLRHPARKTTKSTRYSPAPCDAEVFKRDAGPLPLLARSGPVIATCSCQLCARSGTGKGLAYLGELKGSLMDDVRSSYRARRSIDDTWLRARLVTTEIEVCEAGRDVGAELERISLNHGRLAASSAFCRRAVFCARLSNLVFSAKPIRRVPRFPPR